MTAARDRKEAAKRLGAVLAGQKARMDAATGDAIAFAAMELGQTFNDNIDFICWVLKEWGGAEQMPFARPSKPLNGLNS
jgi:hypothetical protein